MANNNNNPNKPNNPNNRGCLRNLFGGLECPTLEDLKVWLLTKDGLKNIRRVVEETKREIAEEEAAESVTPHPKDWRGQQRLKESRRDLTNLANGSGRKSRKRSLSKRKYSKNRKQKTNKRKGRRMRRYKTHRKR